MMNGLSKIELSLALKLWSVFSTKGQPQPQDLPHAIYLRGAYHWSSPVSLRSFLARCTRSIGVYVSGTVARMTTRQTPAKMVKIQYTHRQLCLSASPVDRMSHRNTHRSGD